MLYILLAGGVFNAVLVPQLVRAMKNDPDGGDGYTNRIITLAALFLGRRDGRPGDRGAAADAAVPGGSFFTPELAAQRESVIDFARYCLPQVFFYGMFVLVGQVLNARGSFGPMMWAPIANNVISVAVLATYLLVFSPVRTCAGPAGSTRRCCPAPGRWSAATPRPGAAARAGLHARHRGAVADPAAVPASGPGSRYRPRFDFRGTGLGHTLRLGHLDGAVRGGQPDRLHRGGADRLLRYGGRRQRGLLARRRERHRLHRSTPTRSCW